MGIYLLNKKRGAINVKRGTRNDEKGVFKGLARAYPFLPCKRFLFWAWQGEVAKCALRSIVSYVLLSLIGNF